MSLVLNVALAAALVWLWGAVKRESAVATPPATSLARVEPRPETVTPAPQQELPPVPPPFRWHQLESSDYRAYVKNLRDSGCPESTVRAIVAADVHAVFHRLGSELDGRLSEINNAAWSVRLGAFNSQQELLAQKQALPGLETAEIATLLGLKPAAEPAATAASSLPIPPVADQPVSLPLVFKDVDLTTLNLTPDQIQTIDDVRRNFMKEIGGANQDPNDPAYLQRWQQALPAADDMLRGMLGVNFFENYQMAVVGS